MFVTFWHEPKLPLNKINPITYLYLPSDWNNQEIKLQKKYAIISAYE